MNGNLIIDKPTLKSCESYLESIGLSIDDYVVTKEKVVHKNWEYIARKVAIKKVQEWKNAVGATTCIIAMGTSNFRDRLPLLYNKYKDRDSSRKPLKLKEVRGIITELYRCESIPDLEADDIISMYQYKGHKDKSYIVCTEDKDADQTPGYKFNPRTGEIKCCNGFGALELIVKETASGSKTYKVKGHGRAFFYFQLITGDPVDTYTPFKPARTHYKFYKEFKDVDNDKDAWQYVVNEYKMYFGDITEYTAWDGTIIKGTWLDILQVYVDVVHMQRWENDRVLVKPVLDKLGVIY